MFQASNQSVFLSLGLTILVGVIIGTVIIRKYPAAKRINILTGLLIAYLTLFFPILEYWSIWIEEVSFWPAGYMVDKSVMTAAPPENELLFDRIYNTLSTLSLVLAITAVIMFVQLIASSKPSLTNREKNLVWVPYANYFQLFIILKRQLTSRVKMPLLILWLIVSFAAGYYSFLAIPLLIVGINSFGIFERVIWGQFQVDELAGDANSFYAIPYDFTFYVDVNHIVLPVFFWLSALLTLLIVRQLSRKEQATVSPEEV